MVLPPKVIHPEAELPGFKKNALSEAIEVETYAGKLHIEWDHDAAVTPMGQYSESLVPPSHNLTLFVRLFYAKISSKDIPRALATPEP